MSNKVIVMWAIWGTDKYSEDVTCKVQGILDNQNKATPTRKPTLKLSRDVIGDFDPGITKYFSICYVYNGQEVTLCGKDGETLDLSAVSASINILGAAYGCSKGAYDVTRKVKELVDFSGVTKITANNATFGNPAPKVAKILGVKYEINGTVYTKTCAEGDSVTLDS